MAEAEDAHFQRLTECVEDAYRAQKPDREIHRTLIRYLAGEFYPTKQHEKGPETALPLLSMAARAMARHTVSKAPRVMANTADPNLKTLAENREISTNQRIKRSNLARELRECSAQSMTGFGTMFMGPAYVGTPDGMKLDLEIKAIDRARYFYDVNSSSLEDADFQGHEIDLPLVDVRDHPLFDESTRSRVEANGIEQRTDDELTNFKRAFSTNRSELYDYVTLRCVFEKRRNKLWYYPKYQRDLKLMETEWLGPVHGPYRYLYYEKAPNHATPIAPLMHLLKKHRSFNLLDVKAIHQQQVAKGLLFYTNASKGEAETILNAVNNQSVLQENGAVRWGHVGGAATDTVAMAEKQRRDFSYATNGILDQFMQQADTLGQERLLRGASNEMLEDMGGWAYQFVRGIAEDIFWFDGRDPDPNTQMLRKPIEGTDLTYLMPWTPEHRRIALEFEYEVDVEPYSYVERSPQSRLADLLGALQIFMTFSDQAAAQGIMLDVEAVIRTIAKYKNLPELYDVLILNESPERLTQLLGARGSSGGGQIAKPNGQYTRRSESDGAGAEMEVMRMFGRGSANPQMAVVG